MTKSVLLALAAVLFTGCTNAEKPVATVQSKALLKSTHSWDGTPYRAYPNGQPELTMLRITIPPLTTLKWHQHPVPNAAYVVSGELTVRTRDDEKVITLSQGDTLAEMVDIMHRGETGESPVELIVFYAGSTGIPLSQ
jgi:quercetin dioxygenase-like cupin family protein